MRKQNKTKQKNKKQKKKKKKKRRGSEFSKRRSVAIGYCRGMKLTRLYTEKQQQQKSFHVDGRC